MGHMAVAYASAYLRVGAVKELPAGEKSCKNTPAGLAFSRWILPLL
jgi:hypothetical protein